MRIPVWLASTTIIPTIWLQSWCQCPADFSFLSFMICFISQSLASVNRNGDRFHPCLTPLGMWSCLLACCCYLKIKLFTVRLSQLMLSVVLHTHHDCLYWLTVCAVKCFSKSTIQLCLIYDCSTPSHPSMVIWKLYLLQFFCCLFSIPCSGISCEAASGFFQLPAWTCERKAICTGLLLCFVVGWVCWRTFVLVIASSRPQLSPCGRVLFPLPVQRASVISGTSSRCSCISRRVCDHFRLWFSVLTFFSHSSNQS